eukprot:scaffold191961_cov15-Tisochrysis_lutea.AAC.1
MGNKNFHSPQAQYRDILPGLINSSMLDSNTKAALRTRIYADPVFISEHNVTEGVRKEDRAEMQVCSAPSGPQVSKSPCSHLQLRHRLPSSVLRTESATAVPAYISPVLKSAAAFAYDSAVLCLEFHRNST